jgi:hypothetical protein
MFFSAVLKASSQDPRPECRQEPTLPAPTGSKIMILKPPNPQHCFISA